MEKIEKLVALISNKITSITQVFGILAIVVGALLLIYDVRYHLLFGGGWDYINNIIVEAHGLFFDLLILGVLISLYERKSKKKEAIERDENLIDDFREWNDKEAMYRIIGAVKRLNRSGVSKINLMSCNLQKAKLKGANLEKTIFAGANLAEANFLEANLLYANFFCANLQKTILVNANLQWAQLGFANLHESNIQGANLKRAYLGDANLQQVNLNGANLEGADLKQAKMQKANLQNANLKRASLQGAYLTEAILSGANMQDAILIGADLIDCKFDGAILEGAELRGAYVGKGWFEKLETWQVSAVKEIKEKYIIAEEGYLKLK